MWRRSIQSLRTTRTPRTTTQPLVTALRKQYSPKTLHQRLISATSTSRFTPNIEKMTQESSAKDEPTNCVDSWENSVLRKEGHEAYKDFKRDQDTGRVSPSGHTPQTDTKRQGRGFNQTQVSETKSSGPEGSPEGIAGDKTRVPKAGQKVQWQGDSGVIKGEAVEVLFEKKTINGEEVEAAKEEPKVVVKDSESGKVYVKSPDEVHF